MIYIDLAIENSVIEPRGFSFLGMNLGKSWNFKKAHHNSRATVGIQWEYHMVDRRTDR